MTLLQSGGFKRTDESADTPIEIGDELLAILEQALAGGVARSLQGAVARNLLSALMRHGRKQGIVLGRIPRRWSGTFRCDQAISLQSSLLRCVPAGSSIRGWLRRGRKLSEAAIAAVSLILHGGYPNVETVMAALSPTATLRRVRAHQDVILVGTGEHETGRGQAQSLAFHGLAALHLRRWMSRGESMLPSENDLDQEIHRLIPANLRPTQANGMLKHLAALARARRAMTMDGMARLIGLGAVSTCTVSVDRIVAAYDGLGVHHAAAPAPVAEPLPHNPPVTRNAKDLVSLYGLLTTAVHGSENLEVGEVKARKALEDELSKWCAPKATPIRMLDLLARYALALLRRGGERRSVLELRTIRGYLYEVAAPLIAHLPDRPLETSVATWNSVVLTIISTSAPYVRGARFLGLRRFHWGVEPGSPDPGRGFRRIHRSCRAASQRSRRGIHHRYGVRRGLLLSRRRGCDFACQPSRAGRHSLGRGTMRGVPGDAGKRPSDG